MSERHMVEMAIRTLYEKVFQAERADQFPGLIAGPYTQHNPLFPEVAH